MRPGAAPARVGGGGVAPHEPSERARGGRSMLVGGGAAKEQGEIRTAGAIWMERQSKPLTVCSVLPISLRTGPSMQQPPSRAGLTTPFQRMMLDALNAVSSLTRLLPDLNAL